MLRLYSLLVAVWGFNLLSPVLQVYKQTRIIADMRLVLSFSSADRRVMGYSLIESIDICVFETIEVIKIIHKNMFRTRFTNFCRKCHGSIELLVGHWTQMICTENGARVGQHDGLILRLFFTLLVFLQLLVGRYTCYTWHICYLLFGFLFYSRVLAYFFCLQL